MLRCAQEWARMDTERLTALIESSDLDELVRFIDGLASVRDWDGIVKTRDLCVEAVERGKQVWAPADFAEYRLARDAPAPYAAAVAGDGKGRYGLGPLWEVAASTHTWGDLEPDLDVSTTRALAAHERVIRGEDLRGIEIDRRVLDLPLVLQSWEPAYPVALYRADRADFPVERPPDMEWVDLGDAGLEMPDEGPADAFMELVRPWWEDSSGHAEALQGEGTAYAAIRALGPHRARVTEVSLDTALAAMVWAGASGGAYGRRRGTPVGRSGAWWVLAQLLGFDDTPEDPDELAEAGDLNWFLWDPGDRTGGWSLNVAVEDPGDGVSWTLGAVDMR